MVNSTFPEESAPPKKRPRTGITIVVAILGLLIYCGGVTTAIAIAGYRLYQRDVRCPAVPPGWELIVRDVFESESVPESHWLEGAFEYDTGRIDWDIRDGMFFAEADAPGSFINETTRSNPLTTDFFLTVDLETMEGSDRSYAGVVFRFAHGQGYYYVVSSLGYYAVWSYSDQWNDLIPWTETRAYHPIGSNRLAVYADGPRMVICLNDQRMKELVADTFPRGYLGLTVGFFEWQDGANAISLHQSLSPLTVAFDNFVIYIP